MSRSSFAVRTILGTLGLLLVSGVALAADDDFEFAQALAERGYIDLAEKQYRDLIADPRAKAEQKAEGQLGLALLKYAQAGIASRETRQRWREPFQDVLDAFTAADAEIGNFIESNPRHPRVLDAKLERARLLQDRAKYVKKALENDWVPSGVNRDELRKQMAQGFDVAIEMLEAVEKKAKADYMDSKPDQREALEFEYGKVWLLRLVALYGKGEALPKGSGPGQAALKQAFGEITDAFLWDFEGRVLGIWGSHYGGLIAKELDEKADAVDFMRTAAEYVTQADAPAAARDVTLMSHRELAEMTREFGGQWARNGLEAFERFKQSWPDADKVASGQRALLSYARLIAAGGRTAEAIELVQEVVAAATKTGTGVDGEGGRVLADLLSGGGAGATAVDPDVLAKVARSKWREGDTRGCIRAYHALLNACATKEQMDKYGWQAWDYIARCYGSLGRWHAAFLAFDKIEQAWKADRANPVLKDMTDETGFLRAQMLDRMARETKGTPQGVADRAAAKKAIDDFATDHPDSPHNAGAEEKVAFGKYRDAKQALRDDAEAGKAKMMEAIKELQSIPTTSNLYDKVEAMLAEARLYLEEYDQAIKLGEAWLQKERPPRVDSASRRAQLEGRAIALTTILRSHSRKADTLEGAAEKTAAYQAFLKALDTHGQAFADVAADGERVVTQWRAEANIGVENFDEAEKLIWEAIKADPSHQNNRYLAGIMARALEDSGDEWLAKGDTERYRRYMVRSSRLREYVLDSGEDRSPEVLRFVAKSFAKSQEYGKAKALLDEALETLSEAVKNETDSARQKRLLDLLRSVRIEQIDLLVDQGNFDEAIPLLEERLVEDASQRAAVIARLQKDDQLTNVDVKELLGKMSRNKIVLESLSRAWLQAKNQKRLIGCINLCAILLYTTPKEEWHEVDYIRYTLRKYKAYFAYGVDHRQPTALDNVIVGIQNKIFTPGYADAYEERMKGSKQQFENLLNQAKIERTKLK